MNLCVVIESVNKHGYGEQDGDKDNEDIMRSSKIKDSWRLRGYRTGHGEHILSAQLSDGILAGRRIAGQEKNGYFS